MPSFCVIESCRLVKQVGDSVSFHKFPFGTEEIFEKWMDFVKNTSKDKTKTRNITKFSSICSQHFKSSDFSGNGTNTRRFLRKFAIPTVDTPTTSAAPIFQTHQPNVSTNNTPVQIILEDDEEELTMASYELCGLCGCQALSNLVMDLDNYNFSVMRKCLPFINFNLSLMQRVCNDCISILHTFSSFIDRVILAQNILNDDIPRNIKVEPLQFEDDPQMMARATNYLSQPTRSSTSQEVRKKCEILEIVDIKQPLNFLPFQTNALSSEINESNLIQNDIEASQSNVNVHNQILSPNQLKVEISDDQNEDCGDNELELIKNFVLQSSVYNHDHNYFRENGDVKIELDEDLHIHSESMTPSVISIQETRFMKICCRKIFKSPKLYLIHKLAKHATAAREKEHCAMCNRKFQTIKSLRLHKMFYCKRKSRKVSRKKKFEPQKPKIIEIKPKRKRSLKKTTSTSSNTNNKCPICFKIFKASKNLYQHKATHSKTKYHCSFCKKSFKMKHGLKQHIEAQHENKRQYTCSICNHNYALKGDLKRCRHSDLKKKI